VKAILALVFVAVVATIALVVTSSNTGLSISPAVKFVGVTTPVNDALVGIIRARERRMLA